jgi:hypothetical protein
MKTSNSFIKILFLGVWILVFGSCEKFVDIVAPNDQLVGSSVFTSDRTATAAMTGIYSSMMSSYSSLLNTQLSTLCGLSADEFKDYSGLSDQQQFYQNSLTPGNNQVLSLWKSTYSYIYQANAVLEGLKQSTGISNEVQRELEGEAKCFRAVCNFYLLNLYGNIPLATSTNYQTNDTLSRSSSILVYQQIIADCKDAQNLLKDDYSFSGGERVRPNHFAATALLARVYLFMEDWKNAEAEADSVIGRPDLFTLSADLNQVFLANSSESIWQMEPVQPGINTREGNIFILNSFPNSVALSDSVLTAFEPNDNRRTNWIDSVFVGSQTFYFPFKYKIKSGSPVTEYCMVFRLSELYLIRAEARAQQDNLSGATDDLNQIRNRAGLSNTTALTQNEIINAIQQERRVEFFTEDGMRWLDLVRTGQATAVLGSSKNGWKSTDSLYPIPLSELQNDTKLIQNPGY